MATMTSSPGPSPKNDRRPGVALGLAGADEAIVRGGSTGVNDEVGRRWIRCGLWMTEERTKAAGTHWRLAVAMTANARRHWPESKEHLNNGDSLIVRQQKAQPCVK